MKAPTSTAFATVPTPGRPPSDQPIRSTVRPTATFAMPNESGVCFERPWLSTSQGERPSFDSRMSTIANANRNSPTTRLVETKGEAAPHTRMGLRYSPNGLNGFGLVEKRTPFVSR